MVIAGLAQRAEISSCQIRHDFVPIHLENDHTSLFLWREQGSGTTKLTKLYTLPNDRLTPVE